MKKIFTKFIPAITLIGISPICLMTSCNEEADVNYSWNYKDGPYQYKHTPLSEQKIDTDELATQLYFQKAGKAIFGDDFLYYWSNKAVQSYETIKEMWIDVTVTKFDSKERRISYIYAAHIDGTVPKLNTEIKEDFTLTLTDIPVRLIRITTQNSYWSLALKDVEPIFKELPDWYWTDDKWSLIGQVKSIIDGKEEIRNFNLNSKYTGDDKKSMEAALIQINMFPLQYMINTTN